MSLTLDAEPDAAPHAPADRAQTRSADDAARVGFWAQQALRLDWAEPWHTTHTFEPALGPAVDQTLPPRPEDTADADAPELRIPSIEWFAGGKLNAAVNCVDRHVTAGKGEKVALHFEGEPGDRRTITYKQLQDDVARAANALEAMGIGRGDRGVIYLPVIVETIVITLAVARIGAIHSLVFGGFSAEALKFRVEDTGAKLLVTTDGQFRRGKAVPVKANADAAVAGENSIEHVLVVKRTG